MTRYCLALAFVCVVLQAAGIRGTVVENQSGKPLSRALVSLQPIEGTAGRATSIRTNKYGAFQFEGLAPGAYVVKASRRGFLPTEYGQKRWNSAGMPIVLSSDDTPFLAMRLPRYGAITGTVVDENDVGLPQHDVVAYRATTPPQVAARATSDERGFYRIFGLEPGIYVVRSGAKQDEGIEYVPTFSRETLRFEESRPVQVSLDEDVKDADVRPATGRLFTVQGIAEPFPPSAGPVKVTLASDMGKLTTNGPGFRFTSLPPGQYDLYAEVAENPKLGWRFQAAYELLNVNHDPPPVALSMQPVREVRFEFVPAPGGEPDAMQIMARRKDFAGADAPQPIKLTNGRTLLAPGRWELLLNPPPGYYVSGFAPVSKAGGKSRPDGWNEIMISSHSIARFNLSSGAASVHGNVKSSTESVAGVPVYLEGYDPSMRQRMTDLRATRTDMRGAYRFDGLAPGTYRVLATFEYQMPDSAAMDLAGARSLQADAQGDLQTDLDLFVIR